MSKYAVLTVLGGALTAAVTLSACGSSTDGSGATGAPTTGPAATTTVTATATATATTTPSAAATTPVSDRQSGSDGGTDLADRLLTLRDLPSGYGKGGMRKVDASALNTSVRACVGITPSTGGVVVRKTSPTFSQTSSGIASTVASYKTQAAVRADAAVLESAKAEKCLQAAVIKQFAGGAATNSPTIEVRPGTNDGPTNEAGVVGVDFVVDEDGRGSRQTVSVSIFYLTGPKVLAQLIAVAYGNPLDADLLTGPLLTTMAKRTAQA